ncbi:uncharacterized protein LOC123661195 [Melitaea cinxia]|uniref:uncharacterized protein LOC123661195 n=1 Tax=Melitaea cinxia TaxID=113334 RepID=UPI001E26F2FB|nr:uncharacterized protein LOC123661195 [Melitaea cinxia]
MANKCNSCGKFTSSADGAKCKKCSLTFHRGCLSNSSPGNTAAPKWLCKGCKSNDGCADAFLDDNSVSSIEAMTKAIELLRNELSACTKEMCSFRQEIGSIRSSLVEFNSRIDAFDERLSRLEREKEILDTNENTIAQLRADINERDQELLLNDIEITGITELDGENLTHVVNLVGNKIGVNIDERDIVSVQRAGPRRTSATSTRPRTRAICVRLARRSVRDEILRAARVRRGADSAGFNIDAQPRRFYVNERLTRTNRQLFYAARAKAKEAGWRYVWTRNGRIFARRDAGLNNIRHRIGSINDIEKVFCV